MTQSEQEELLRAIASSHTHEHTPSPIAESSPRISPRHSKTNRWQGPSTGNSGAEDRRKDYFFAGQTSLSNVFRIRERSKSRDCLLYTSDAAEERSSVDIGGRRIIKNK